MAMLGNGAAGFWRKPCGSPHGETAEVVSPGGIVCKGMEAPVRSIGRRTLMSWDRLCVVVEPG